MNQTLNISSGPHVRGKRTTRSVMLMVVLALLPAAAVGVAVNGLHALWVILAAVASAVATEFVFDKITKKGPTYLDGSAVVTGLLLALSLSPDVPVSLPILGSVFAILVVKCCFGGLGKNFVNPALAARCFLLISFGRTMTEFKVDGVSSATPVADLLAGRAVNVTEMFLGTSNSVIGGSILALLIGGLFLWVTDIIHGEIWISVIAGFTLFIWIFGGQGFDPRFFMAHLCGGGVVMAAFFMATDYTTSPVSRTGQMIYGLFIGVLGGLFRLFGSAADSFSYSVIVANLFTPVIDILIVPKPFAYRKGAEEARSGSSKKTLKDRIPRPVIALTVITLIAGLALSGVYTLTKDSIEAQQKAKSLQSYREVIPDAETFETMPAADAVIEDLAGGVYGTSFGRAYINEAVVGKKADGSTAGYAVSVTTADGNDADISLAVGVSADGVVNGIYFTALNETPGMGMRCGDPDFMEQFEGKSVTEFVLLKGGASAEGEVDAISGATVTSSAVVNAVNAGLDFCNNVMKEAE